jgi:hypothetical protein
MKLFAGIKNGFLLVWLLLPFYVASAQPQAEKTRFSTTEYQHHDSYYERITYLGKRKDHYIVETYLADSTLYRVDNYKVVDRGNYYGIFAVRHGPTKLLYADGRLYLTCDYNMNELNGPFTVYYNDGAIKRRELYRNGKSKKSVCYDTAGNEQVCETFYQRAKFVGNTSELQAYMGKNLQSVLEGHPALLITMSLIINEIGQVIDVKLDSGRSNPRLASTIRKMIQDMPRGQDNEPNWKPATMDGRPIPATLVLYAQRDRAYWRVSFQ